MDEAVSRTDARLAVLEQKAGAQERQISELFQRVNNLERQQSAHGATQQGMQADITDTKQAAQRSESKIDALKMWMLGIAATTAVTAVLTLISLATRNL